MSVVLPHRRSRGDDGASSSFCFGFISDYIVAAGKSSWRGTGPRSTKPQRKRLTHLVERVSSHWEDIEVVETKPRSMAAGYGDAVATGCRRATGDYVLLLNNDVTLAPLTLRVLAAHLNARKVQQRSARDSSTSTATSRRPAPSFSRMEGHCSSPRFGGSTNSHYSGTCDASTTRARRV